MAYGMLFAIISPIFYALMNVFDKYVVSHKVKSPIGFVAVVGLVNLALNTFIALSLNWTEVLPKDILFPALSGILIGVAAFFYILLLEKEDMSHVIGFVYTYPLLIALLAFIFLNEKLSMVAYFGVALIITGTLLLSLRFKCVHLETNILFIILLVITTALNEFFIKIATNTIGVWQGIVINNIFCGLTLLCVLFHKQVRPKFLSELHNARWEIISATLVFGGVSTLFFAMAQLPATIVSSIAAIQPIVVLFFETIVDRFIGKITKDKKILPKGIAIAMITAGVMLLYLTT